MTTVYLVSLLLLTSAASQAQTAITSQPTQAQQPCLSKTVAPKPGLKLPPKVTDPRSKTGTFLRGWGIIDPNGTVVGTTPAAAMVPCAPSKTEAPPAPSFHLPAGVITTWLCNPVITSSDHSVTYVMPSDITDASPAQANTFQADFAKPDPKATTACSSLHKDPKTSKFWLAQ